MIGREALRGIVLRGVGRLVAPPGGQVGGRRSRLLLVRPDHLGDILFLTPALRSLREAQPAAEITALVGPWAAPLLARNPDVDAVETLDFPWFDRRPRSTVIEPYLRLRRAADRLRGRFDVAVILRFDHWWGGWLAAAAGIPVRIGYSTEQLAPFLTEAVPYRAGRHEVLQNLTLTARLGTPATTTPEEGPLRYVLDPAVLEPAGRWTRGRRPLVALHPGSGATVKQWPHDNWTALATHLVKVHGAGVLLTGAAGREEESIRAIVRRAQVPATSLAGKTTLEMLAAVYAGCDLVVGPDTGPLHLAVAVGTPTVHLYGPVSPQTFGPWGDPRRHRVLTMALACQYCHRLDWPEEQSAEHPCVSGLPLSWVIAAVDRALQGQDAPECG